MASNVAGSNNRFDTSVNQVVMAGVVLALCVYVLMFVINTTMVQEIFGYTRHISARVPTFFMRMGVLLAAIAAGFFMITGHWKILSSEPS